MNRQGKHRSFAEGVVARQEAISGSYIGNEPEQTDFCTLEKRFSARNTFSPAQLLFLILFSLTGLWGLIFHHEPTIVIGAVLFSLFYFLVILFRSLVLADFKIYPNYREHISEIEIDKSYAILVALYKEASQVMDLVQALTALKWPTSEKFVYLLCEEHDRETLAALYQIPLPDGFKILIVPKGKPMTKPRALNYGLARVHADYLVIYDAEDRPHPNQLLEAENAFRTMPKENVCLQSPLSIDNHRESWLTKLFSIEYDTLFHGILPSLAKWQSPIPLGGTSNHFRVSALKEAGGWDSYNVTEDADLGIRLARFKYRCGTLTLPTYEEAPASFTDWMKQRTRWIKGWMQTLLVHLRQPIVTAREMGLPAFFKFHMVLTSVMVSVLVHPFFLIAFFFQIGKYFSGIPLTQYDIWMTGISTFNLVAGYTTYGLLAFAVQSSKPRSVSAMWILTLPFYWILISAAGWRALYKLIFNPHEWEKTPHESTRRTTPTG